MTDHDAAREAAAERYPFAPLDYGTPNARAEWDSEAEVKRSAFIAGWNARSEQPAPASEAKAIIAKARAQASWARASSAKPPTREDMADCVDDLADFIERLSTAAAPAAPKAVSDAMVEAAVVAFENHMNAEKQVYTICDDGGMRAALEAALAASAESDPASGDNAERGEK